MKTYDCECPICGHLNKDLNLIETDGWMECDKCGESILFLEYQKTQKIPVFSMDNIPAHLPEILGSTNI